MTHPFKTLVGGWLGVFLILPLAYADSNSISPAQKSELFSTQTQSPATQQGPMSFEPNLERDHVQVSLKTSLNKQNEMTVVIKISNLSDRPVLVSPDAVEAATEEGFVISPISHNRKTHHSLHSENNTWSTISKAAALIPFSTPYRIVSSAKSLAQFTTKTWSAVNQNSAALNPTLSTQAFQGSLREVILQPGMATHGSIIYDASFIKAYSQTPTIHIKVRVNDDEPFEFKFSSHYTQRN